MKTRHYFIIAGFSVAIAGIAIVGCKKNDTTTTTNPTDITAAQDDANAGFAVQDSKNIADGAASQVAVERVMSGPCASWKRKLDTTGSYPGDSMLDISFGNSPCQCLDGRYRSGHIIVWYHNGWATFVTAGDSTIMGFRGYTVGTSPTNGIGIAGTRTLTNIGTDTGNAVYTWKFHASLTLTYPNGGGTATWSSTRTNTYVNIGGNYYFAITGSASGKSRSGATYNITIDNNNPLYVQPPYYVAHKWIPSKPFCQDIMAGKLTITVSTFSYPIYVTFNNNAINPPICGNAGTATINGISYPFTQQ